jgi:diguanylate cyclase
MKLAQTLRRIFRPRDPRRKVLLWATMLALFCGITDIGQPVDLALQVMRNEIRKQPVSGDIIIVGVDDKTIERLGGYPISNRAQAKVLNTLSAMGAKSVHYDTYLRKTADAAGDQAMADALRAAKMPVTLPVGVAVNPQTGKREEVASAPLFRGLAPEVSITTRQNMFGFITRLPLNFAIKNSLRPTMAAYIAEKQAGETDNFRLDYSYDLGSIRPLSFIDLVDGSIDPRTVAGKTMIIAPTAPVIGDIVRYVGGDRVPGAYIHLIGAELLRIGTPVYLGFLPFLIISFGVGFFALRGRLVAHKVGVSLLCFPLLFALGVGFESMLFSVELLPAFILLGYAMIGGAWIEFGRRRSNTNAVSGLSNLAALRDDYQTRDAILVTALVRNYDQISAVVTAEEEPLLVAQIAKRLAVGSVGAKIYQADSGSFAWVIEGHAEHTITDQLSALHAMFLQPVAIGQRKIDLHVTFGLDDDRSRTFLNRFSSARLAAEKAAQSGQRWQYYDAENVSKSEWQLSLLGQLDLAIENGEIWVAYQPQLDLSTNQICAAEALVRWTHPTKGNIRPDEFILAAEENNRIGKLTRFVLDKSLAAVAEISAKHRQAFRIGVNMSARIFDQIEIVAEVKQMLSRHQVSPSSLILELTETAALRDNGSALKILGDLRAMGVGISLDDYGTGFSTLSYLRDVPANELKIDRQFVSAVAAGGSDRLLVASTIALAHSLGMSVVAEGVEQEDTLKTLREMGCDLVQGYLIGEPLPYHALTKFMAQPRARFAA